jgi:hypothetical protein
MVPSTCPGQRMLMCTMSQRVNWAGDAPGPATEHMRINHVGFDVTVPHQLLDASKTASAWQARRLALHISMLAMASLLDGQLSRLINGIY